MKEAYVTYKTAKLLKEKGFDWECHHFYYCKNNVKIVEKWMPFVADRNSDRWLNEYAEYITAPTQQMACRWLIETYNIHIEPHFLRASGDYVYGIIHSPLELDNIHSFPTVFDTKEDAIEAALQYVLTNLI